MEHHWTIFALLDSTRSYTYTHYDWQFFGEYGYLLLMVVLAWSNESLISPVTYKEVCGGEIKHHWTMLALRLERAFRGQY